MLHLRLLAVVMAGSVLFERVDSCLRNVPPVDQWDGERLSDLRVRGEINTLTAVVSDYVFHCNGIITQWRLQWYLRSFRSEMCTITFTFYALRPEAGNDCILTPVGSNTVTVGTDGFSGFYFIGNVDRIFNISAGERITVQAGDMVGLRVQLDRDCDNTRLWIAGTRLTDNVVYHDTIEDDDREELPQLNAFDSINICRYERDEESPYITAVVEPLSEATPTSIHSPETSIQESPRSSTAAMATTVAIVTTVTMYQLQPSGAVKVTRRINFGGGRPAMAGADDSGGNMVILTSVGASVGVLLVVAAALTAVLCVWQCSRKRISQSAPEKPPHFAVVENEAYGIHTKHPQQQQQQQHVRNGKASGLAPGRPQQFVMEENEAYKVHTHHSHETDLNGYYDPVDYKEEEGNDYVVKEPVYDLPS